MRVDSREHINLLILGIQKVLEFLDLRLQLTNSFLERFRVTAREGTPAQLVRSLALKADITALCTTRTKAVTTNLLTPGRMSVPI